MTRFVLIIAVSAFLGVASATRLGLFGLLAVSGVYLAILLALRTEHGIGFLDLLVAMVVIQGAYVLGGWLCLPMLRRSPATGSDGEQEEEDR